MAFSKIICLLAMFVAVDCLPPPKVDCPPCNLQFPPCAIAFRIVNRDYTCFCDGCFNECPVRDSQCEAGETCVMQPMSYDGEVIGFGEAGICKPFEKCPQFICPDQCPESGYYIDKNGCTTCLCKDPCKELKCSNRCSTDSPPGLEPIYWCESWTPIY